MNLAFLKETQYRPWPLPRRRWVMSMRWENLLFAHWPVPAEALRALVPERLELDVRDGVAWLGVIPFRMSDTRLRGLPAVPGTSSFLELNVRTYVTCDGKPGVWFFSLDASSRLAVRTARQFFFLPYFDARMQARDEGARIFYESTRTHRRAPEAAFAGMYGPVSSVKRAQPGTIEHWLTERYCLYSADRRGRVFRGEIHHQPWPLQRAEASIEVNRMADPLGLELPGHPPLLHFARELDVAAWRIVPI